MTTRPRQPAPGTPAPGKLPLTELAELKARRQPIAMVTAYDAPTRRLADAAGVDLILVGDSAAMTVLGHDSTVPVTMDEMIVLTRAVARGAKRPIVVADMPFGSFQVSDEEALHNAIRFVKEAGADAVKLEGAGPTLSRVQAIVGAGIPVMGHVGLTPQSATVLGGFKAQGRTAEKALRLYEDALALEAAGCFAIVLEAVPAPVAARITEALTVPTIGIGAGAHCDGQVLVWHDLLGLYEGHAPRFVKQYADLAEAIKRAVGTYVHEVRERRVPGGAAHVRDAGGGVRAVFEGRHDRGQVRERTLGSERPARGPPASVPTSSRGQPGRPRPAAQPTRRRNPARARRRSRRRGRSRRRRCGRGHCRRGRSGAARREQRERERRGGECEHVPARRHVPRRRGAARAR